MAWYCTETVRFRGRLVKVTFRYDAFHSAKIAAGRPLRLVGRELRKIKRLLRKQGKAFGPHVDHGCGGPPSPY